MTQLIAGLVGCNFLQAKLLICFAQIFSLVLASLQESASPIRAYRLPQRGVPERLLIKLKVSRGGNSDGGLGDDDDEIN